MYAITLKDPLWSFGGSVGRPLTALTTRGGEDAVGPYREISFAYFEGGWREAAIRLYLAKPVALFTVTYRDAAPNASPFPILSEYPRGLFQLGYEGLFGKYDFRRLGEDGPWVFFDAGADTFILSPASAFMSAATSFGARGEIRAGISPDIASLPAGFSRRTVLVFEKSINRAFETWGRALTDLHGKTRPGPDADISLSHLGYWTDNGAAYYYDFEPELGYEGTLFAIGETFRSKGIPLGYLQLDSWFYPKGPLAVWWNSAGGTHHYEADPTVFPETLQRFQEKLGLPLIAHGRWLDPESPLRKRYKVSGNVAVDRGYWDGISEYLKGSGAVTYEQDWLGAHARTAQNLSDPDAYLDLMAEACRRKGLTIQYCMPLPRHYLQTARYGNVTTIRTSDDRFERGKWDQFLYGSRVAAALGVWPWADVFMSTEPENVVLATLSAGPVGVGDRLASLSRIYLVRVARSDARIVKPDAPIVPLDETVLADAQAPGRPMIAATFTDFNSWKAWYVFAYSRGPDRVTTFRPGSLGLSGTAYVYDYFARRGRLVPPGDSFAEEMTDDWAYYIVVPVGPSGIAFLGDEKQFVSLGKQRIGFVADDGALEFSVYFAPDEKPRAMHGYAPFRPAVTSVSGDVHRLKYDSETQRFTFVVEPGEDLTAWVRLERPE